ncbi:MAG: nucleotidyltransferase family protein [Myxococcales bacterium]|nr:nucleotidyltransferase family protein [Myxococcales bacterium]MCB9525004.1 nucleotidyltransferase family protein [Myxococcales bacterium]
MDTPGLIRTLSRLLDGAVDPAPTPAIIAAAEAHRLAGVLHHRERRGGRPASPRLAAAWGAQLAGHLARLEWLQAHWPADLPTPMLFKGADLADHLYPDAGCRGARDVDVLVPGAAWPAAREALAVHADHITLPSSERWPWQPAEAVGFVANGLLIELHRTPGPPGRWPLDGDALYARSVPAATGWGRVPAPADRCLLWLVDAAKAGFHGDLGMWWDLALLRARWPDLHPTASPNLAVAWRMALAGLNALGWQRGTPQPTGRAPRPLSLPPHDHAGLAYQIDKLRVLPAGAALRYLLQAGSAHVLRRVWPSTP